SKDLIDPCLPPFPFLTISFQYFAVNAECLTNFLIVFLGPAAPWLQQFPRGFLPDEPWQHFARGPRPSQFLQRQFGVVVVKAFGIGAFGIEHISWPPCGPA